jgi:hypothetical protein
MTCEPGLRPGSHVSHFLDRARCGDARHRTTLIHMCAGIRISFEFRHPERWMPLRSRGDLRWPRERTSSQRGRRQVCMRSIHLGFPNRKYDAAASSPEEMTDVWTGPKTHVQPPSPRATAARAQITYCTHESAVCPGACTKLLAEISVTWTSRPSFTNCQFSEGHSRYWVFSHPTSGQTEQIRNSIAICRSNKTKNHYMTHSCLQQHTYLVAKSCGALTASAGNVVSNDINNLHVEAQIRMLTRPTHSDHYAPSLTLGSTVPRGTGRNDRPHWVDLPRRMIGPTQRPIPDNTQHFK